VWLIQWLRTRTRKNEFGIPIRNFGKVNDGLYRGALPGGKEYRLLRDRLAVRRIVSLIDDDRETDRALALESGIEEWAQIPFSDRAAPDPARVRAWLDLIRDARRPVYTHCRGGRHRTGMLVAVYRVTDGGWSKARAIEEMKKYGWYGALGHQPLLDWFQRDFDPHDYRAG
jgi:hypothetical protein